MLNGTLSNVMRPEILRSPAGKSLLGVVTVSVAVPTLPAASLAVAVQTLVISEHLDCGAVNVPLEKLPPFVHVTVGPEVTPTLSVADGDALPVWPAATVSVEGLKLTEGAITSPKTVGGGGGGGGGTTAEPPLLVPPPPPQAASNVVESTSAVVVSNFFKTTMGSPINSNFNVPP